MRPDVAPCPKLDPIELARGVLSALAYPHLTEPQAIHVGRLQTQFARAGISDELTAALNSLVLLREVEDLGHGYWAAGQSRAVRLAGELSLIASISPTNELMRHFQGVATAGIARLTRSSMLGALPVQSLASWLEVVEPDTRRWTKEQLAIDRKLFRPVTPESNMEVFSVSTRRRRNKLVRCPQWLPWTSKRELAVDGIGLYRLQLGSNYQFVLGMARNTSKFLEGPNAVDPRRLQYGITSILGKPLQALATSSKQAVHIQFPARVPFFVYRLLRALCTQDVDGTWACRMDCWPTILSYLNSLGCEVLTHE